MPQLDDHSLLMRVDEKLTALMRSVDEMRSEMAQKASIERVYAIEKRLDKNEREGRENSRKVWIGYGAMLAVIFILQFLGHAR